MSSASVGPDVSIVVVNFNSGPALGACLRAARRDDPEAELVVVDNASSDDSLRCLESAELAGAVTLIRNDGNLGFSRAVNIGAAHARADALLVLNPDCIVYRGAIASLLRTLNAESRAGIVGGLVVDVDGSEQRGCRRHEPTPKRIVRRLMHPVLSRFGESHNGIDRTAEPLPERAVPVDAVSGAFMLIRREAFERAGGFDEGYFLHFEDLDICRQVRDAGMSVLFEPCAVAVHFKSASGGASRLTVERHKHDGLLRYLEKFHAASMSGAAGAAVRTATALHVGVVAVRERLDRREKEIAEDERAVLESLERLLGRPFENWVVVTGATSQVGDFLLPELRRTAHRVLAVTRGKRAGRVQGNTWWVRPGFADVLVRAGATRVAAWFHLAPIWIIDEFAHSMTHLAPERIVAVGSSSIETKKDSPGKKDRRIVALLEQGERQAMEVGRRCGARVTLFRPTMIYGNRNNRNVEVMRRVVRLGFFPMVGEGAGRRQPLHAADLASACLAVLDERATFDRIYFIGGGEVIEFQEMIRRIFQSEGKRPRFVRLPPKLLRSAISLCARLPGLKALTPDMVDRIGQDLVFDNGPAARDFGFSPRGFDASHDD